MEPTRKRKRRAISPNDSHESNLNMDNSSDSGSIASAGSVEDGSLMERIQDHFMMAESSLTMEHEQIIPSCNSAFVGKIEQHLNLLSASHSGLGSAHHNEKEVDESASTVPLLSPSHSALESTQENDEEPLDDSASTLSNVEVRHFNMFSKSSEEKDTSRNPINTEPASAETESLKQNVVSHLQMLNVTLNETDESNAPLNDTLNETHESNAPLNDTLNETHESDEPDFTSCNPINKETTSTKTESLKQNIVSHLKMLNDTLNETYDSNEPLNDTLDETLESNQLDLARFDPINSEPDSTETKSLTQNIVSHFKMLHDTHNDTQESSEPGSDHMQLNNASAMFFNEERCSTADKLVELQDRSGPADDAYFSTPIKVPPLTILNDFTMSPVSSISEDSGDNSGSEEGSKKESTVSEDEDSSSYSSTCGDSSDFEENGTLNLTNNLSDSELCSNSDKSLLEALRLNDVKLYEGSELSVNEAILQIIDLYLKNKESKSGLRRIVQSMTSLLPHGHRLPSTNFILNLVESLAPCVTEEIHCFCKVCILYTEAEASDQPCPVCEKITPQGKFYTFSVRGIVKYLFECRNLASILDSTPVKSYEGLITDVSDGSVYKTLNMNRSKYDLTIILNSDGVRVKKNSKSELWVLLGSFVEIPIHLRDSFIVVFGLWYDEVKPDNMNTFLKPFAEEMVSINQRPVEWKHPQTSEGHESEVRVQLAVADAPARAKMQNILNFNGKRGCNLCEIKSVKCSHDPAYNKRKRIYPYKHNLHLRTAARMHNQAEHAVQIGKDVKGVKGPSILSIIPSIDISVCFIPEYMHSVLLGVVKTLITIWIEKRGPWNIKKSIGNIDCHLEDILHPDFVHRVSRKLDKISYWKASDYYYFLLFESLPVLHDFLPGDYYQHLILLVRSIFQLLKRNISNHDLEEADLCLKLFVNKFSGMYPERDLTYNVHQLLHLSLCVKRHGPLSCTSAFAFEGINGTIAKATHGTYNIGMEIVNNIKICQGATVLKKVTEGLHVHQTTSVFCKGEPLGDEKRNINISQEETDLINGNFKMYSRAKVGYEVFTSLIHKKLKSANFHVMFKLYGEVEYARIKYFFVSNGKLSACLKMYKIDHLNVIYNTETLKTIDHLVPVLDTDRTIIVNGETLASFVKVGKVKNYLFKRPNLLHQVM